MDSLGGHFPRAAYDDIEFGSPRKLLGRGATSKVFQARWKYSNVALKLIHTGADISSIMRELEIIHNLKHERIVFVYAVCDTLPPADGDIGILMELATSDLQTYLEPPKIIPLKTLLRIAVDIADAMRFCHSRGLIHRDLKSKNICITADCRGKVMDFGISRFLDTDRTAMTAVVGTPQYSAPETLDCDDENAPVRVHSSCDVYSFGVVLWEMVMRERPWGNMTTMQILTALLKGRSLPAPSNCSPDMKSLISSSMSLDPASRPPFNYIHDMLYASLEREIKCQADASDSPPFEFLCPIMYDVMESPVITADGHSYERSAIESWLSTHSTSPLTNAELANKTLIPNLALKASIAKWRESRAVAPMQAPPPVAAAAAASRDSNLSNPSIPASRESTVPPQASPESIVSSFDEVSLHSAQALRAAPSAALALMGAATDSNSTPQIISPFQLPSSSLPQPTLESRATVPASSKRARGSVRPCQLSATVEQTTSSMPMPQPKPTRHGATGSSSHSISSKPSSKQSSRTSTPALQDTPSSSSPCPDREKSLRERIFDAAAVGHVEELSHLIAESLGDASVINWSNPKQLKMTSLHAAARGGYAHCLSLLLSAHLRSDAMSKIDINKTSKSGATALVEACCHGHLECVQLLLEQPGIDVDREDSFGESPLIAAAVAGHRHIVFFLISKGCDWSDYQSIMFERIAPLVLDVKHEYKCSQISPGICLLEACMTDDQCMCASIADKWGSDSEIVNFASESHYGDDGEWTGSVGYTPLLCAAKNGFVGCVEALVSCPGLDVNLAAQNGDSALACACFYGNARIAQHILSRSNCDVNQVGDLGWTALNYAARWGHIDCIKLLLAVSSIDVNKAESSGYTPLSLASFHGHADCVSLILMHPKVDVNKTSSNGLTPLICASGKGHTAVVQLLATFPGVDLNTSNAAGINAWFWASEDIKKILHSAESVQQAQAGASATPSTYVSKSALSPIKSSPRSGGTPEEGAGMALLHSVLMGDAAATNLLLTQWANNSRVVNWVDAVTGDTPLIVACWEGKQDCCSALLHNSLVDVNKSNFEGVTAAIAACANGHASCLSLLIGHPGVDFNKPGVNDQTPLHYAVFDDRKDCVQLLMELPPGRVDSTLRSKHGSTPRSLATSDSMGDLLA